MATPQTLDVLSRYLANGFREADYLNQPSAGQRYFGRGTTNSFTHFSPNANDFDFEITRNDEKTAALVARSGEGPSASLSTPMGQLGQSTWFSRKYPWIVEEIPLTAEHLYNRVIPGEGPFEGLDPQTRLQRYATEGYRIMIQRMERAQERLAWQSLTLGKQSANVFGTPGSLDYDWRRAAGNSITLTHGWGNAAGVPLTDLDTAAFQLRAVGHVEPHGVIMGSTAFSDFIFNTTLMNGATIGGYASQIFYQYVSFNMNFKPDPMWNDFISCGLRPKGKIQTPAGFELTIFTYPQGYNDPTSGTWTKYLNDAYAVMISLDARADRLFGPPDTLPMTSMDIQRMMERFGFNPMLPPLPSNKWQAGDVITPQMFYVDSYEIGNRSNVTLRVQGAPVFPTTQTDAIVTILNAGTST